MTRQFKLYAVVWAVIFAIFNIVAFAMPIERENAFWIGYVFIILAYVLQLACGYKACQSDSLEKVFYSISILKVSYSGLAISGFVGIIAMLIANFPIWLADIICFVALGYMAIAIVKADAAVEAVEAVGQKVKVQTFFMKALTADAQTLISRASTDVAKENCNAVYELIRYSDTMSNDALASIESQITIKFQEFATAVTNSEDDKIPVLANELNILVTDRNNKCKLLK